MRNNRSKKQRWKLVLLWVLVLLVMSFIFLASAQDGDASGKLSSGILQAIITWFKPMLEWVLRRPLDARELDFILRKMAHFSEYALLCFLLRLLSHASEWKWPAVIAWAAAAVYACTDEFHQLFSAGRGASVRDVGIDSMGALLGLLLATLVIHIRKKKQSSRQE